jgi:hypothetical protein
MRRTAVGRRLPLIPHAQETFVVPESISELANKSGVSPEQAQKGLGALLAFLKGHLPADIFAKLVAAVPHGDDLMAAAQTDLETAPAGGVVGAVKALAGKLFGGGGGAAAAFTHLGFSPEQVQAFLRNVLGFLKGKLPDDVMKQVSALLPGGEESAG